MASESLGNVLHRLGRSVGLQGDLTLSDAQLLDRFVSRRDEPAFAALMARHGPMVLGVCRRLLRDAGEAEDAFQAAFLVLARKAPAIQRRALLGAWLYGVAFRVAARQRTLSERKKTRERPGFDLTTLPAAEEDGAWSDIRPVVHEEVQRLPQKYRNPIVLCYLEGKTHEEAAAQLRAPLGTVKSQLTRAREMLRSRLARRGLALSSALVATALVVPKGSAAAPLLESTLGAAIRFAAGDASAGGLASAKAVALSQGVLRTMAMTKVTFLAALVLALTVFAGIGGFVYRTLAAEPGLAPPVALPNANPPAPVDKPKDDRKGIQGLWHVESILVNGKDWDDEEGRKQKTAVWTITDDRIIVRIDAPPRHETATYKYTLDPTQTPRTLDVNPWDRAADVSGKTILELYSLEGDILKICNGLAPNVERPKEIASKEGGQTVLFTLKRVPPEQDKPKEEKSKGGADAEKIQGTWVAVSGEAGGKEFTPSQLEAFLLVITLDQIVFGPDFFRDLRASYKLDPTKTPKEIELTSLEGFAKWKAMKDIYNLDGDRLTLCIQYDERKPPPTEFATKADSGLWLFHLKRWPREDAAKDLTAEIIAPAEVASTDPQFKGRLLLTNKGDATVRICTLCSGNDGLGGPFGVHFCPDWWKSDRPTLEQSAKSVVALEPGKSCSFPVTIQRVHFQDRDTFLITGFYSLGEEAFAKKLDLWRGKAEAAPLLVKVNRK